MAEKLFKNKSEEKIKTIYVSDLDEGIFVYDGVRYEVNPDLTNEKKFSLIREAIGFAKGTYAVEYKKWLRTKKTVRIGFEK